MIKIRSVHLFFFYFLQSAVTVGMHYLYRRKTLYPCILNLSHLHS